jgi:hypothetical protein
MFIGHDAVALAGKSAARRTSLGLFPLWVLWIDRHREERA